jgi:hypothetical protein
MANPLAEAARSVGLEVCGRIIGGYGPGVPAAAAPDDNLRQGAPHGVPQIIGQLVRRGLQPSAIAALREEWSARPLERSLLAWDVLNGAVLSDRALAEELRDEARLVGAVLPEAGKAVVLRRPEELDQLVRAIAVPGLEDLSSDELTAGDPPLGGLRVGGVVPDKTLFELTRQYARLLHRAHLPTLASFRLADLYFHHHYEPALRDLVEVLLDQESTDVESWIAHAPANAEAIELATYARLRSLNNRDEWDEALTFADAHRAALDAMKLPPARGAQVNPRPTLAYAEAALRAGKPTVSFEHVAAITNVDAPWRYAFRVLLTYSATRIKDAKFVSLLAAHIEKFGNDLHVWYDPMAVAPDDIHWGQGFVALLAREGQALRHNPDVWKAAALLLADENGNDGVDEVDARLRKQATLT